MNDNKEVLYCRIDDNDYFLDFTNENQDYLRSFFNLIIHKLKYEKIQFVFDEDNSSIKNEMLISVSKEYINDLNTEIELVYHNLKNMLVEYSMK